MQHLKLFEKITTYIVIGAFVGAIIIFLKGLITVVIKNIGGQ